MHELSITRAIVETVSRHAGARRVASVRVAIGALRQVSPDSLRFYFEIVSRGTACEGALLDTRLLPARVRCACGEEWELADVCFRCPRCGGAEVTVVCGEELCVESIEVEEERCTAPR
jgi:hydrogenase nickel incorporation protein HypA/HybF